MALAAVWQGLYLRCLFTGDFCCAAKVGVTHFFARALATDDLQEIVAILRFLVHDGEHLLGRYRGDANELYQLIKAREPRSTRPIFFVLTGEMAGWMQAIHKIASWDIQHGK